MTDWDVIKAQKQTVNVYTIDLHSELAFTVSYQFFYRGEQYLHFMAPAVAVGVTKLAKLTKSNKVVLMPEDLENLESKIRFKTYSAEGGNNISISDEDIKAFEKRFRMPITKYTAYMLRKAVENIRIEIDKSPWRDVDLPNIWHFKMTNASSSTVTDEYTFGINLSCQFGEGLLNILNVREIEIPAPLPAVDLELPELF